MPIYEYECRRCGKSFEELVMSSSQDVCCPGCGSAELDKLISAFAKKCGGCGGGSSGGPT